MPPLNLNAEKVLSSKKIENIINNEQKTHESIIQNFFDNLRIFISDTFCNTNLKDIINCIKQLSKQLTKVSQDSQNIVNIKQLYSFTDGILELGKKIGTHKILSDTIKTSIKMEKIEGSDEVMMHFMINDKDIKSLKCQFSEKLYENLDLDPNDDSLIHISSTDNLKKILDKWKQDDLLDQSDIQILENSYDSLNKMILSSQIKQEVEVKMNKDLNISYQDDHSNFKIDNLSLLKKFNALGKKSDEEIKKFVDAFAINVHSILPYDKMEEGYVFNALTKLHYLTKINRCFPSPAVDDIFLNKITDTLVDFSVRVFFKEDMNHFIKIFMKNKDEPSFDKFLSAAQNKFKTVSKEAIEDEFIDSDKQILLEKISQKANSAQFKNTIHELWTELKQGEFTKHKSVNERFAKALQSQTTTTDKTYTQLDKQFEAAERKLFKKTMLAFANKRFEQKYSEAQTDVQKEDSKNKPKKNVTFDKTSLGNMNAIRRLKGSPKVSKISNDVKLDRTNGLIALTIDRCLNESLGIKDEVDF